jgi:sugar phosphate isomerase/epimerase
MNSNSIAAQLYTLRDFLKTREDIAETLKKVSETGYKAVQVSGMGQVDPVFLKELTAGLGLTICATHTSFERIKNETEAVIKEHKLWNCEYVGIGSMPGEFSRDLEGYKSFAREVSALGEKYAFKGLKLIYHNHNFEFEKYDGVTGLDILLNETNPGNLGFEIDTYWVQAGGGNPVQWLKKVAGRIDVVHFKDMAVVNGQQAMAEIGQGNLDWPSIISTCREIGVKWYAVEQDVCRRSPFESLSMSFEYLQKFI